MKERMARISIIAKVLIGAFILVFVLLPNSYAADNPTELNNIVKNNQLPGDLKPKQEQSQSNHDPTFGNCQFDPTCYVQNWLLKMAEDAFSAALQLIAKIMNSPLYLVDNPIVKQFYTYFENSVWALISTFFVFHLVRILALYWVDEDIERFKRLIIRLIVTGCIVGTYPTAFQMVLGVVKDTTNGFANIGVTIDQVNQVKKVFVHDVEGQMSFYLILFIILAVFFLVAAFQSMIRSAELAFMFIVGPFAIATNLNEDFNLFPQWWRTLISIFLTQVMQIILLTIFVNLWSNISLSSVENFGLAIGFLFLVVKTPAMMKDFVYSTGIGKTVGRAVGSAGSAAGAATARAIIKRFTKAA